MVDKSQQECKYIAHTHCTPPRGLSLAWGKVGFPALKQASLEKLFFELTIT